MPYLVDGEAYRNEVNKVFTMKKPSRLPSQKIGNRRLNQFNSTVSG
ncbi:conserved hypothetical protein [Sinorhizobium medicae]|uniref:Uncharacterized protein n=1 Tax=Sinorhizobium medicae TaxID=110321 RepID=A0A508WWV9_9HYPH|nr:conserved hypothetical protein [Sinorhizobium medicae]